MARDGIAHTDRRDRPRPHERRCRTPALRLLLISLCVAQLALAAACATPRSKPKYIYAPDEFRAVLRERVPELPEALLEPPYQVSEEAVAFAREQVQAVRRGPDRVHTLIRLLQVEKPHGFGLRYQWSSSATAMRTLESGRGNCISLASVLVGLGRGLKWPIYYAIAEGMRPDTYELEDLSIVADHMVVVIAPKTFQLVIDFTGEVDESFQIRAIDDLSAHAHFINNLAGGVLIGANTRLAEADWEQALAGFQLASRIDPTLARAWNNSGIALSRLGRVEEARAAYAVALELEPALASATRNLSILETRASSGIWAEPAAESKEEDGPNVLRPATQQTAPRDRE